MTWKGLEVAHLQEYVYRQQEAALAAYEGDPDLIEEHVRQEDSYRSGGYGTRQISELLQNAVDALSAGGSPGRIEFRLAGKALYCANEGAPFAEAGLRAVTHAFLSGKRDEEIGRFGLGFKSVLGITDHPQIYSRSVSFEFNPERTHELLSGLQTRGGRLPLLRVPSIVDPDEAAAADPHLAELREWATTVVKLPLARDGARIRTELDEQFNDESLVLLASLSELTVTLEKPSGDLLTRTRRRHVSPEGGTVTITDSAGKKVEWYYAERVYEPTEEVAATLPDTARRKSMTVSYAVNPARRTEVGRLWAWFPLLDQTTAGGLFNAPWQVNDDRTHLVEARTNFSRSDEAAERLTPLNKALLDVATDLFLDVVVRASTADDPAAHLDLFPARGRETRSVADEYLSEAIPRRATERRMVPDTTGELVHPTEIVVLPDLEKYALSGRVVETWARAMGRTDVPHPSCFRTPTRIARLRTLIAERDGSARGTAPLALWLAEPSADGSVDGVRASLQLLELIRAARGVGPEADSIPLVPTESGRIVPLDARRRILLPVAGAPLPEGLDCVRSDIAEDDECRRLLEAAGFRRVSQDEVATALADALTDKSEASAWDAFWTAVSAATPAVAVALLRGMRSRGVEPLVPTRAGTWRAAKQVFAEPSIARNVGARQADRAKVPNVDLLHAAGCLNGPRNDVAAREEKIFDDYVDMVFTRARRELAQRRIAPAKLDVVRALEEYTGPGPLTLLTEGLDDNEKNQWCDSIVRIFGPSHRTVNIPIGGRGLHTMAVPSLERWALGEYGLVTSTLGPRRPDELVGDALGRFGNFLPVANMQASHAFSAPSTLAEVPDGILAEALGRDGFPLGNPRVLTELLEEAATRSRIRRPDTIPAIRDGRVTLSGIRDVVIASPDDVADVVAMGWAYVPPSGKTTLTDEWGIEDVQTALAKTVEAIGTDAPVVLEDLHPSISEFIGPDARGVEVIVADALYQVISAGARGTLRTPVASSLGEGRAVLVDRSLDAHGRLAAAVRELDLGLSDYDVQNVLIADEKLRRTEVLERARAAGSHAERLLILVGVEALRAELPRGFLEAVERAAGPQSDRHVAELFLRAHGNDALRVLRERLKSAGIRVPSAWDGSAVAQAAVRALGFGTEFAGEREIKPPRVTLVPGKLELNPLHDYQEALATKIRDLVTEVGPNVQRSRGLLTLPTGAGKTRVTAEAVLMMMRDDLLSSPVLWIAQSMELCEQAIQTFSEVWRWLGDQRPVDLSRFWSGYDVDESNEELQIVFAIDDTLDSRLPEAPYAWLREPSLVVIDEAHTAGDSPTYTRILAQLGLTAYTTARPLLGLTATPFKGRNPEVNRAFAGRFGNRTLEVLDPEDPIAELRARGVLSEVDHTVLPGLRYEMDAQGLKMRDVSKAMLDRIGADVKRTELVVDHIADQPEDWPILVFMPSVAAAHTAAALLELRGIAADAVDGSMRTPERRRVIQRFRDGETRVLLNCDLLTQGFDAPMVRALYIARPTFSPNRYIQMVGRGLRGPENGGTDRCLIVNVADTFDQFGDRLAFNDFDYLWGEK